MSIIRSIVERLNESRKIEEASFNAGGSEYKCVFGKYYKDGETISREDYFSAKEKSDKSGATKKKSTNVPRTPKSEMQRSLSTLKSKYEVLDTYMDSETNEYEITLNGTFYDDKAMKLAKSLGYKLDFVSGDDYYFSNGDRDLTISNSLGRSSLIFA